jgi:uncharacterized delta-60 repeat protein
VRGARRHSGGFLVCLVVLLLLVALPQTASAQSGDLDPAFGEGGRIATTVEEVVPDWSGPGLGPTLRPETFSYEARLATAPDGSVVVAHGNLLLRYLPDGQLDRGFGEAGKLTIGTVAELPFGLADFEIDSDGRILVFGTVVDTSTSRWVDAYSPREASPSFVTVIRLDSTGSIDPTFGGGDGVFLEDLGLRATRRVPAGVSLVDTESAELDSEGRAVIAVGKVGFPPYTRSTPGYAAAALIRLTSAGTLDLTFGGGDGVVEGVIGGSGYSFSVGFCISSGDRPIVALESRGFARLRVDGSLDRAFGRGGFAKGVIGRPVCDRWGHFYVLDGPNSVFPTRNDPSTWRVIRRSDRDGHLERGFSRRAIVRLRGKYSYLTSLTVDRDGRVLPAGFLNPPDQGKLDGSSSFFTVFRLLPSGRLDESFGHHGRTRTGFGRGTSVETAGAEIDPSGRLVLAGQARAPQQKSEGMVLGRYLIDQ